MSTSLRKGRAIWRSVSKAGVIAGVAMASTAALAGECPADKMGTDVMQPGATAPKDVTDTELAAVDLAQEMVKLDGRRLRMRELVIQAGGEVPWHSHGDRPGLIYVLEGTMTEYSSGCSVPIEHKAGEVSREYGGESHWWKNNGSSVARLLAADIVHDQ